MTGEAKMLSRESTLEVYPVPASNILYLNDVRGGNSPLAIMVTSLTGQIMYQSNAISDPVKNSQVIDVSDFREGIYFVTLQNRDCFLTRKICVVH
jgi:hypothetical protein